MRSKRTAALVLASGAALLLSVDGPDAAMLAPARAQLAKAVESGRSTRSRADRALARLEALVGRLVTRTFPAR